MNVNDKVAVVTGVGRAASDWRCGLRGQVRGPACARTRQRIPAQRRLSGRPPRHLRHRLLHGDQHASIGFTEWLAATYIDQGIGVSVLCPAAVRTPILAGKYDTPEGRDAITTDEPADIVVQGLAQERFMISTHEWVLDKFAVKAHDYDEYIAMMRVGRAAQLTNAAAE